MIGKPADRIIDRVPGTVSGSHQQAHVDRILSPVDGVGVFFTAADGRLGVALQLADRELGHLLVELDAIDVVGLYRLLEPIVTMDEFALGKFIERVGNHGEAN
jgi:hypothetical protein